jgi:hypothetical protein
MGKQSRPPPLPNSVVIVPSEIRRISGSRHGIEQILRNTTDRKSILPETAPLAASMDNRLEHR